MRELGERRSRGAGGDGGAEGAGGDGKMRKLTQHSTLPVPCYLFPVPCSLFPDK